MESRSFFFFLSLSTIKLIFCMFLSLTPRCSIDFYVIDGEEEEECNFSLKLSQQETDLVWWKTKHFKSSSPFNTHPNKSTQPSGVESSLCALSPTVLFSHQVNIKASRQQFLPFYFWHSVFINLFFLCQWTKTLQNSFSLSKHLLGKKKKKIAVMETTCLCKHTGREGIRAKWNLLYFLKVKHSEMRRKKQ